MNPIYSPRMAALILVLGALIPLRLTAAEDALAIPPVVTKGFQEFQKNGSLAAVGVWLAGSARDNDGAQDLVNSRMSDIQGLFGRMLGHEIVRTVVLSPSTRRVYAAVKFEKGVAWMSFDCYRPQTEWIVARFDFGTNANLILPPNILGGQ